LLFSTESKQPNELYLKGNGDNKCTSNGIAQSLHPMKKLLRLLLVMAGILSLMAGIYWMHRIYLRHELASYQR